MNVPLSKVKESVHLIKVWQRYSIFSAIDELLSRPIVGPTGGPHRLERVKQRETASSIYIFNRVSIENAVLKNNKEQQK